MMVSRQLLTKGLQAPSMQKLPQTAQQKGNTGNQGASSAQSGVVPPQKK
jgi:hypothetical protein